MTHDSRYRPYGGDDRRARDRRDDNHNENRPRHHGLPPRPPQGADAYRPSNDYSDRNGRNDYSQRNRDNRDHGPPLRNARNDRDDRDSFRPPQGDFSFRFDKPSGVQDSYRPDDSRPSRNRRDRGPNSGSQGRPGRYNDTRRGGRPQGRGNFGGRPWRPFVAAERELLSSSHTTGDEQALYNAENGVTYRDLDELSDSEEAEMDISGDEADGAEEPSTKRARLGIDNSESGNSVPKWSNPDPYTALPPETSQAGKKKDVVQLIRKARVQEKETRTSLPSATEDFISFDDFDDSDDNVEGAVQPVASSARNNVLDAVPGAPTAPRPTEARSPEKASNHADSAAPPPAPPKTTSTPAPQRQVIDLTGSREVIDLSDSPTLAQATPMAAPSKTRFTYPDPTPSALGSRKRTFDDEVKLPHSKLKRGKPAPRQGMAIVSEWKAIPKEDPTPWTKGKEDHSASPRMGVWLHKEIADFYDYIRPRDFEERIRNEVIADLNKQLRSDLRDAAVYPFGSFPSGLYLPTGDMDLALLSDQYRNGKYGKYNTKNALYRVKKLVIRTGRAFEDDVDVIAHAKVPLVKYVDSYTGLKIDISFENTTGIQAIKTFTAWKEQYPAMPVLVTLIKHFLCMRGLNEPVNGGIGGFSVICLVVSMLQLMPQVQSGNMDTRHHLGELLMEFFDLYGNRFDYRTTAICLHPPKYIPKHKVTSFAYKNHERLSIIDPNNPENDISGGSSNIDSIMRCFSEAHRMLSDRMKELAQSPNRRHASILEVILAGNYQSFRYQRAHLQKLATTGVRPPPPSSRHIRW